MLQAYREGTSLRGTNHITGLAYNTLVSIVHASSARALLVHNNQVEQVETWHRETTNGKITPTAEQVWQSVGADKSDNADSGKLL